jgi:hypothetical protein
VIHRCLETQPMRSSAVQLSHDRYIFPAQPDATTKVFLEFTACAHTLTVLQPSSPAQEPCCIKLCTCLSSDQALQLHYTLYSSVEQWASAKLFQLIVRPWILVPFIKSPGGLRFYHAAARCKAKCLFMQSDFLRGIRPCDCTGREAPQHLVPEPHVWDESPFSFQRVSSRN